MSIDDILGKVPDASGVNMTPTKKFKRDVYEYFNKPEWNDKLCAEFGCFHGHTTIVLCSVFKHVYCFDNWQDAIDHAKGFLSTNGIENVTFFRHDLYAGLPVPHSEADVVFIDSKHTYDGVKEDIMRFLRFKSTGKKWFILHDYRLCPGIRDCVRELVHTKVVNQEKFIGDDDGGIFEGVILSEV
jgi:hypothetical protein